jgi:hypothetical protein
MQASNKGRIIEVLLNGFGDRRRPPATNLPTGIFEVNGAEAVRGHCDPVEVALIQYLAGRRL